jgi:two-component system sporulation sensor kinase A/two-component system, sporulation sensor kinase E
MIRYAISVCRETAVRAQGRLIYDGPAELARVRCGSTELAQIFINLVANAAQALLRKPERGGRVLVSAADAGDAVRFAIADDGPGMSAELLRKVGTPFFSTRPDGTGLGVAQCRRLIERAGGQLLIESTEGRGTTVSFTIPKAV